MNKKKYLIIIALVVFVFLALFTFANPLNKDDASDNRVLEEIEEDDLNNKKEEPKETEEVKKEEQVITPVYNNHGVNVTTKPQVVIDDSYEKALEAVVKAEITLDYNNLDFALKLVELVKDETKKSKLEERLSSVKDTIELVKVIDEVVEGVKESTNKSELNKIRENIDLEEITEKVNDLSNEVVKKLALEKLKAISGKLNDTVLPIINIEDGAILNSDTKITVTDDSEVVIKLNGEIIENNKVVSDGSYVLTAIDASFNEVTIEFIVDTKAPEFVVETTSVGTGEYYSKLDLVVKDDNLKNLVINGVEDNTISPFEVPSEYYQIGENVIVATDAAGNETTFAFTYVETVVVLEENTVLPTTEKLIIEEGETYVLDLNNNIYTVENENSPRNIKNYGTLIIKNGKMVNSSTEYNFGLIDNYGKLLVDNVEFTDNAAGFGSTIKNRSGEVTITNSKFVNNGTDNGNAGVYSDGKLTIENTTFTSLSKNSYPLRINSGEATIKNVEVDGTTGALCINSGDVVVENLVYRAKYMYYGIYIGHNPDDYEGSDSVIDNTNVTIKGGEFYGKDYALCIDVWANPDNSDINVIIEDGTFVGPVSALLVDPNTAENIATLTIKGGNYSSDITSYLDTNEYESTLNVETGYYEVSKKDA